MADENQVGSVSVGVQADLTQYSSDLERARQQAVGFDQSASASMGKVGSATEKLTVQQRSLVDAMLKSGLSLKTATEAAGKTADSQLVLAAFTEQLTAKTKAATAEVAANTTANLANANSSSAISASVIKAFQDSLKAAKSSFDLRSALTRQQVREFEQGSAAEVAAAKVAAKEEDSLVAASAALRTRLTRQQTAETIAADKAQAAAQEDLQRRATVLRQNIDPFARPQSRLDAARTEASALGGAGVITTEEQTAAVLRAEQAFAKEKKALEEASSAGLNNKVVTESLAGVHEILQGRTSRLGGTVAILGQALLGTSNTAKIFTALLSPVGLAVSAVTAGIVAGTLAVQNYENALRQLRNTSVGSGAASAISSSAAERASQGAAGSGAIGISNARSAAEAYTSAGVSDPKTLRQLQELTNAYGELTGRVQKFFFTATDTKDSIKGLAAALGDLQKGTLETNKELNFLTLGEERDIDLKVRQGDLTKAQAQFTQDLAARTLTAANAAGGLETNWTRVTRAFENAGSAAAGLLDKLAHLGEDPAQAAARARLEASVQSRAADIKAENLGAGALKASPEFQADERARDLSADASSTQKSLDAAKRLGDSAGIALYGPALKEYQDTYARVLRINKEYSGELQRQTGELKLQRDLILERRNHQSAAAASTAAQIRDLKNYGTLASDADIKANDAAAGGVAGARVRPPKDTAGRSFARDLASINADANAELELAHAYTVSASEAIRAEASRKALTEATKQGRTAAQQAQLVQAQINLDVAKDTSEAAKKIAGLEAQAQAEARANDAVARGDIGRKEADRAAQQELEFGPLLAAADLAQGKAKDSLTDSVKRLQEAQEKLNDEGDRAKAIDDAKKSADETAIIRLRQSTLYQPKRVQDRAVAQLTESQNLGVSATNPATTEQAQAIKGSGDKADAQSDLNAAEFVQKQTESFDDATRTLLAHTSGLKADSAAQAAAKLVADALNQAERARITLTDEQISGITRQAQAYAKLDQAVQQFQTRQKSLQDTNKQLTDQFETDIEGLIDHTTTLKKAAADFARTLEHDVLKATLSGEGPMAGLFGTAQGQKGQGGVLGQAASGLEGLLGIPGAKPGGKPTGSPGDPIYTKSADAAGAGGPSSLLSSLTGGDGGPSGLFSNASAGIGSIAGKLTGSGPTGSIGDVSTMLAGILHTGTNYVGTPGATRAVSPSLFIGAPRLHSGLAPGEFPAILQEGEGVSARGSYGAKSGGGNTVNLHVHGADTGAFMRSGGQVQRATKRAMAKA